MERDISTEMIIKIHRVRGKHGDIRIRSFVFPLKCMEYAVSRIVQITGEATLVDGSGEIIVTDVKLTADQQILVLRFGSECTVVVNKNGLLLSDWCLLFDIDRDWNSEKENEANEQKKIRDFNDQERKIKAMVRQKKENI